jgi:hypothetical protein
VTLERCVRGQLSWYVYALVLVGEGRRECGIVRLQQRMYTSVSWVRT